MTSSHDVKCVPSRKAMVRFPMLACGLAVAMSSTFLGIEGTGSNDAQAAWVSDGVQADKTTAGEYPSGTWRMWWPVAPFSPMAYYTMLLDLNGGVGTFKTFAVTRPEICDTYGDYCPCVEGEAIYSNGVLRLEGDECGASTAQSFRGTGIGAGLPVMDFEFWFEEDDGTGHGGSTVMRKAATP